MFTNSPFFIFIFFEFLIIFELTKLGMSFTNFSNLDKICIHMEKIDYNVTHWTSFGSLQIIVISPISERRETERIKRNQRKDDLLLWHCHKLCKLPLNYS